MKVFIPFGRNISGILADLEKFGMMVKAETHIVVVAMEHDDTREMGGGYAQRWTVVRVDRRGFPLGDDDDCAPIFGEEGDIFVCNGGTTAIGAAINYLCDGGLRGRRVDVQRDGVHDLIMTPSLHAVARARKGAEGHPDAAQQAAEVFPPCRFLVKKERGEW